MNVQEYFSQRYGGKTPKEMVKDNDNFNAFEMCHFAEEFADQQKPKWIPCEERLPEKNVLVLICKTYGSGTKDLHLCYLNSQGEWDSFTPSIITHWTPLPEKPTK